MRGDVGWVCGGFIDRQNVWQAGSSSIHSREHSSLSVATTNISGRLEDANRGRINTKYLMALFNFSAIHSAQECSDLLAPVNWTWFE